MKCFNKADVVDSVLMSVGLGISLQDIQSILSIIIICLDILWITCKFIVKFCRYIKDGKLTDEELDDLTNDVNGVSSSISELKKKDGDK